MAKRVQRYGNKTKDAKNQKCNKLKITLEATPLGCGHFPGSKKPAPESRAGLFYYLGLFHNYQLLSFRLTIAAREGNEVDTRNEVRHINRYGLVSFL